MIDMGWNLDNSYTRLPNIFFSKTSPTPVSDPKLIILNQKLAQQLELDHHGLQSKEGVDVLSGNYLPKDSYPLAQAYAGHQFGYFTMLGDGRAILIGEQITKNNERYDLQLKGAGKTPYSRGGDGRATLGPMLREYIISEAMYALGIPTTRSLAVTTIGEPIVREKALPGAILARVAKSHLRVGTFQYAAKWGSTGEVKALADYTIERHFPEINSGQRPYLTLLQLVIKKQAELIAKWQLLGFIHGVMNTDNMTISGETIDYGPCAFMDSYNPNTVFSSIDRNGRYAYGNQPKIAQWNLARFAETLLPLLHDDEDRAIELANSAITEFTDLYQCNWLRGMKAKLGLLIEDSNDHILIEGLLKLMEQYKADFTNTFRSLSINKPEDTAMYGTDEFAQWYKLWQIRISKEGGSIDTQLELMRSTNPSVIPRNHRVEEALEAAVERGDYSIMIRLIEVLSRPYQYSHDHEEFTEVSQPDQPYKTYCGT